MQAVSGLPKDASNHIPWFKDQGIPNPTGCPKRGFSLFSFTIAMPAGGVIALPYKMANGLYQVFIQNHTDPADEGTVDPVTRLVQQITVVGPDAADVLDIAIMGQLDGQLD